MKTVSILVSLALSSMLASGEDGVAKVEGEWQSITPSPRRSHSEVSNSPFGPVVETWTFNADRTYENVLSCKGAFAPIRTSGTYIIAGDKISFYSGTERITTIPFTFEGNILVFPQDGGHRYSKKE